MRTQITVEKCHPVKKVLYFSENVMLFVSSMIRSLRGAMFQ